MAIKLNIPDPKSRDDLRAEYVPPKQKTTKFRVIKIGSVIRTTDGTVRLVIRTKKNKATKKDIAVCFGVQNANETFEIDVPADHILEGIAEIRGRAGFDNREVSGHADRFEIDRGYVTFETGNEKLELGIPGEDRSRLLSAKEDFEVAKLAFKRLVLEGRFTTLGRLSG